MPRFTRLADWLSWQQTLHPRAIDLDLARLRRTLAALGWRRPACPIVTVGGTNGKGSSAALLNRILACAGYRVGMFTSPHLVRYNERIVIADREISDAELVAAFERIDEARGEQTLTFFEFNTLAALLAFERADLDAIVLEVGMGGRLDAVNVVDADVALVTSIALDHCEWLGADLEAIAAEKAGIFRGGRPAVYGSPDMPAAIDEQARHLGADLLRLGIDFGAEIDAARGGADRAAQPGEWTWWSHRAGVRYAALPAPALPGAVQYDNAAAVLQVLHCLRDRLTVDRGAIETGLRSVRLAGRFQIVPGEIEWVLDVAHNPGAARTLAAQLRSRPPAARTFAVVGILGDKDIASIARSLRDCFTGWIVAGLEGPRALEAQELAQRLAREGAHVVATASSVEQACEMACGMARHGDRIVAFGSFLTVGPVLDWLSRRAAHHAN